MPLSLSTIIFDGFEVPNSIHFGGRQSLVVHQLPGGTRVVDVMGPDAGDVDWHGVLYGENAADRARQLDLLRVSGSQVSLTWDSFVYSVIVSHFIASFEKAWWIPYRIRCVVVEDWDQQPVVTSLGALAEIATDLASVQSFVDVSAITAAIGASAAETLGTGANAMATSQFSQAQDSIASGIVTAGSGLSASDLTDQVTAAGSLAQLVAAQGYLNRAAVNFSGINNQ